MRVLLLIVAMLIFGVGVGYYLGHTNWSGEVVNSRFDDFGQKNIPDPQKSEVKEELIVGLWKSLDDPKFTREFKQDFSVIDRYDGDPSATMEASWYSFMSPTDEPTPFPIQDETLYIKMITPEEVMYFSADKITDSELQLSYQGGGGVLRFTRMK